MVSTRAGQPLLQVSSVAPGGGMTELVLPSCERQCTRADGALPGEGKVPHHARVIPQGSDQLLVRALHDGGRVGSTEIVQRHAPQVQRTRG